MVPVRLVSMRLCLYRTSRVYSCCIGLCHSLCAVSCLHIVRDRQRVRSIGVTSSLFRHPRCSLCLLSLPVCACLCSLSPLAPRPCTARPPSQCVHGHWLVCFGLGGASAGDAWSRRRSRYSAGRRGVSLEGLTWFSGFGRFECRRQGERRGARMLACWSKGWGVQPKQAWWSRLAKAVVQRLWRPRGRAACAVCVPCARMQCISQTLTHMYTAPESGDALRVLSVACVASSSSSHGHQCRARVSQSVESVAQFVRATPLISSCRSSCGGACGRGRACGGRCSCVRTWNRKWARSRRAVGCGRGARRGSRSWSCCSGSGPPRASLTVACRRM